MLKDESKINDTVIDNMMNWRHSGFNVYCDNAIWPHNEEGLENLARYITRGASACASRPGVFLTRTDDLYTGWWVNGRRGKSHLRFKEPVLGSDRGMVKQTKHLTLWIGPAGRRNVNTRLADHPYPQSWRTGRLRHSGLWLRRLKWSDMEFIRLWWSFYSNKSRGLRKKPVQMTMYRHWINRQFRQGDSGKIGPFDPKKILCKSIVVSKCSGGIWGTLPHMLVTNFEISLADFPLQFFHHSSRIGLP